VAAASKYSSAVIPEVLEDEVVRSGLRNTFQLSAELSETRSTPPISRQPAPPIPRLSDWASFSTFLRPLPYTQISDLHTISVFEDGKPKSGSTFTVRPLELDDDGKLGDLEIPPGKTLVLKSVNVTADDLQQPCGKAGMSNETQDKLKHLCMEINALTHPPLAAHPNIIKLFGFTQLSQTKIKIPSLILERAEYGTLEDFVSSPVFEREKDSHPNQICADIADGVSAIHSSEIIHGDLKPANILVCRDEKHGFIAKIGDLGYSVVPVAGHPEKNFGTDRWAAPELFGYELQMSKASDVYSFGLVAWYVFAGGHDPFDGMDDEDVCLLKLVGNEVVAKAFEACSDPIRRSILDVCLRHNPDHRSCVIVSKIRQTLLPESEDLFRFSHNHI
jgi:serine/threonine protein kinase